MYTPFELTKQDGIIEFDETRLSGDPSVVVPYPSPPGETFFHVDDLKGIRPGQKIQFVPECANDPAHIRRTLADLHLAHKQIKLFPSETNAYWDWAKQIQDLEKVCLNFYSGRYNARSERIVQMIDSSRNLIVVTQPFGHGYKPRIMGAVFRIDGFSENAIDEISTDRLHKKAKEIYGSHDWQSEFTATGKFPAISK